MLCRHVTRVDDVFFMVVNTVYLELFLIVFISRRITQSFLEEVS